MVDIAQRITSLTTRPPTPPKERNESTIDVSSPNGYFARFTEQILLNTPNESPSSSAEYFAGSSGKGTKKVEFSPWPLFHKSTPIGGIKSGSAGNIRPLPPSRDCKSSKSILKETFRSSPLAELPALDPSNIPKMLQSAILHLRSASRSSRLDAYSALLGCMSAYDEVPDTEALKCGLPDFVEFISRDTCATTDVNGTPDSQLISQSLKLLIVFLCTSALANALPDDFCAYILDKSIISIEDVGLPKILVTHHMQVLAKQTFSGKHMTTERANRLLSALEGITDRHKGNSIVGLRLRIYQRLLIQAKPSLVAHSEHWIDHLVSGMLSTTKDIRALAINLGIDAGTDLGNTNTVSQACFDLFSRKSPEGQTVVDFLATRLNAMIASKEEGVHVPQIWSVVILLLRNRRQRLERWLHLKPWLLVIQKCFNSNEAHIKLLAMTAWNRLVFVVEPGPSTGPQMVKMLRQPIVAQLNRRGGDKSSKQSKQIAQSSYCNLLYYAFRPLATHAQLDLYWDHYIEQIMPENFTSTKRDIDRACEILAALLHNEQPKPWNENRANANGFIKPDELPCLDSKWVRSRADRVLRVLGKLVHLAAWPSGEPEKSAIVLAWRSFIITVADAGKQEVKVSLETMSALAHTLNMINLFWVQAYVQQPNLTATASAIAIAKVQILIQEAIDHVGLIPLNEQRLLQSSPNRFEAAETPSSRSIRHQGTLGSATIHLLRLLTTSIADDAATINITPTIRSLLQVALSSTSSRRSQLGILRELTALVSSGDSAHGRVRLVSWRLIAEATVLALGKPRQGDSNSDSPQFAGHQFRDVGKILEVAIYQHSSDTISTWQKLFATVCKALREETGEGGVVLILTEPLSTAIQHQLSTAYSESLLAYTTTVAQNITWLNSQQTLDRARKLLWGISTITYKAGPCDPFDKFYSMVECGLLKAYEEHASTRTNYMVEFLHAVEFVLTSAPVFAKSVMLIRIQRGIATWIEDQQGILAGFAVGTELEKVHGTVKTLWTACKAAIHALPHTQATLTQLEALIISSLCSRHKSILNDAIALWNDTFGAAEHLDYPETLRKVLSRLSKVTELQLPTFPYEDDTEAMSSPFNFVETQASQEDYDQEQAQIPAKAASVRPRPQGSITPSKILRSPPRQAASSESKSLRRTIANRVSKTPSKARLRHNESQIHFAPIDSSPLAFDDTDSQLLTNHQKEIKERQTHDAAIFPKVGSSPQSKGRKREQGLPRLDLGISGQCRGALEPDDRTSPILPVIDGNLEAFLGSSPTPRSSRKFSSDPLSDGGPPSSPPGVPSLAAAFPKQANQEASAAVVEDDLRIQRNQDLEAETLHQSRLLEEQHTAEVADDSNVVASDHIEAAQVVGSQNQQDVPEKNGNINEYTGMQVFSDFDVFVDAPAEPPRGSSPKHGVDDNSPRIAFVVPSSPEPPPSSKVEQVSRPTGDAPQPTAHAESAKAPAEDEVSTSRVMDSFLGQSSQYSNDDEEISAQIAADIERATSQAERTIGDSQATGRKKKRKRGGSKTTMSTKRLRSSTRAQQYQVVVESRKPDDITEDDRILLDTRSANNSPVRSSPHVKQDRKKEKNAAGAADRTPTQWATARQSSEAEKHDHEMRNADQDNPVMATPRKPDKTQIANPGPSPGKSTCQGLMDGLKTFLGKVRQVKLRPEEERALAGVLFDSILEVHEAGKRHLRG